MRQGLVIRPILIAGPTASGKSDLALLLAETLGGVVINADSQQVYCNWRILTARPSSDETQRVPHRLYGHIRVDQAYSTGHWLREAVPLIRDAIASRQVPIVVGGTGLNFVALTHGLADIPPIPDNVRAASNAWLDEQGLEAMVRDLSMRDPGSAAEVDVRNPRRVQRAWEVLEASGVGIAEWKRRTPRPSLPLGDATPIALMPTRDWLYDRCDRRFVAMIDAGVLDEVRAVRSLALPRGSPGLKAVGAPELMAYLDGTTTLGDATTAAQRETRRYAKRQLAWLRNQMPDWSRLNPAQDGWTERALALCRSGSLL